VDWRLLEVNAASRSMMPDSREQVIGKLGSELRPAADWISLEAIARVAQTGKPESLEAPSELTGRWYTVHYYSPRPGLTAAIASDITGCKRIERELAEAKEFAENIVETVHEPLLVLTPDLNVMTANAAFYELFEVNPEQTRGRMIYDLGNGQWDIPALRELLEDVLPANHVFDNYEVHHDFETIGQRVMLLNARRLDHVQCILLAIRDITERKRFEEALRDSNTRLKNKVIERTAELEHRARQLEKLTMELSETEDRERRRLAEILHDDLQQQLAAAKFHLGALGRKAKMDASLQGTVDQVMGMLQDAIEKSRSLSHELSPIARYHGDFGEVIEWLAHQVQEKHGMIIHVNVCGPVEVSSDPVKNLLFRAAQEILFNAVKHAGVTEAVVHLRRRSGRLWLGVCDRGRGFDPEVLRQTTGYGLVSIRERVELLGGRMRIRSAPGRGSTFVIVVPDVEPPPQGESVQDKAALNQKPTAAIRSQ
jgi:PAS domain S-box-containing protein